MHGAAEGVVHDGALPIRQHAVRIDRLQRGEPTGRARRGQRPRLGEGELARGGERVGDQHVERDHHVRPAACGADPGPVVLERGADVRAVQHGPAEHHRQAGVARHRETPPGGQHEHRNRPLQPWPGRDRTAGLEVGAQLVEVGGKGVRRVRLAAQRRAHRCGETERRPTPRSIRPGKRASSIANCSATTSGW
ncbi:hypothetical protein BJF90_06495 [Pseudonocardia sp. CNS-004]|nr:hypothetical protein BJF90_06495 [Pseudonocardia sp. CNS-004]